MKFTYPFSIRLSQVYEARIPFAFIVSCLVASCSTSKEIFKRKKLYERLFYSTELNIFGEHVEDSKSRSLARSIRS